MPFSEFVRSLFISRTIGRSKRSRRRTAAHRHLVVAAVEALEPRTLLSASPLVVGEQVSWDASSGQLPQDAGWNFFEAYTPPAGVVTLADGVLTHEATLEGQEYWEVDLADSGIGAGAGIFMESTLKVISETHTTDNRGANILEVQNSHANGIGSEVDVYAWEDQLVIVGFDDTFNDLEPVRVFMDTTDTFHTYRVEMVGRNYEVFVDGVSVATGATFGFVNVPAVRARFGDGSTDSESVVERTSATMGTLDFPHSVDLSSLDGGDGFVLEGIEEGGDTGYSVSSAGDVNGDGFDDLIVGGMFVDQPGHPDAGETYVVFGGPDGFPASFPLASLDGTNGFAFRGRGTGDVSGQSARDAGDVNGDGLDDIIIGAHLAGDDDSGEAYVVYGKAGGFPASMSPDDLNGANGFVLKSVDPGDITGYPVSSAGDVNGDGFDDLAIAAGYASEPGPDPVGGAVYIVFGKESGFPAVVDLENLNGSNGFTIFDAGRGTSTAGDVNGDGYDDILVGEWFFTEPGGDAEGQSYVIFGHAGDFSPSIRVADLDGSNGFAVHGIDPRDRSGRTVSNLGDINADGYDDIMISALYADPGGECYVIFGSANGYPAVIEADSLDGTVGFTLYGLGGSFGRGVSGAGDVNGDGFDDMLVGAPFAGEGGEVYIIYGHAGAYPAAFNVGDLDENKGFVLQGMQPSDAWAGRSARITGDVNGDGFDDIIVGAYEADHSGGTDQGKAYVVFGGNFTGGEETQVGGDGNDVLQANQGPNETDILIGGRGDDTLISDGGDDVLRGGEGDDVLAVMDDDFDGTRRVQGGNGHDTLRLDGSGIALDLRTIADNRITDVEQIDIRGSGSNSLALNVLEVLNLSTHSNTLIVRGDANDLVQIDSGFTRVGNEVLFGQTFAVFTQGAATLKIEAAARVVRPRSDIVYQGSVGTWLVAVSDGSRFSTTAWGNWEGPGLNWVDEVTGDFNGDGLMDIAARDLPTGDWYVGLSDGDSFNASPWVRWNANKQWGQIQVADFNGDGRDDIAGRIQNAGDGRWFVSLSTGDSFTFHQHWATWNPNVNWGQIATGDFNGDGRDDIVGRVQDAGDGRWFALISTGSNFLYSNWNRWLTHVEWGGVHVGDFNGDGRDDIAARIEESSDGRWFLGLSDGSKFNTLVGPNFAPGRALSHELVGDFDGDGDSEIAARLEDDGRWFVLNLTGNTLGFRWWTTWGTAYQFADGVVGDFDGDGRDDIAARSRLNNQWYVAQSDAARFNTSIWGPAGNDDWDVIAAGDFA